jgi:hypothetical protein
MAKFMVILQSRPGPWQNLSPEEIQQKVEKYRAWVDGIRASGRHAGGEKLGEEGGKVLDRQGGRLHVLDGPYSDAKEVVGGFLILRAADYDEAVELMRDSPFLEDYRVMLRQTDPMGCGGE